MICVLFDLLTKLILHKKLAYCVAKSNVDARSGLGGGVSLACVYTWPASLCTSRYRCIHPDTNPTEGRPTWKGILLPRAAPGLDV